MHSVATIEGGVGDQLLAAIVLEDDGDTQLVAGSGATADIERLTNDTGKSRDVVEIDLRDVGAKPLRLRLLLKCSSTPESAPVPAIDSSRHILIVDDEQQNRSYYEAVLSSQGYSVQVAATGEDGYRAAQSHHPALVLLDVRLPDTNGYEVARLIRTKADLDDIPILLMSADPDLAVQSRIKSTGAAGFLDAPISPDRLLEVVEATRRRSASSATTPPAPTSTPAGAVGPKITLFGPPALSNGDARFKLASGRSAELFATLAVSAPDPVPTERLAYLGWAEGKPATAGAVYTAMSRLRTSLTKAGFGDSLESNASGYRITVDPEDIDVLAFDLAATEALRAGANPAIDQLKSVLSLWSTTPFATRVDNEVVARFGVRLHETRARLLEYLAVRELLIGEFSAATLVLQGLLADEPWRENAWTLLITSLYRSGRQRDALEAFQDARTRMASELGVDPGPRLKACELMILQHDPALLTQEWVQTLNT